MIICKKSHTIYIDKRLISLMCSMQCLYVGPVSLQRSGGFAIRPLFKRHQ